MYNDPALVRKHRVNLSLNDDEQALIDLVCRLTGAEKAAFVREMVIDRATQVLAHRTQSAPSYAAMPHAQSALLAA